MPKHESRELTLPCDCGGHQIIFDIDVAENDGVSGYISFENNQVEQDEIAEQAVSFKGRIGSAMSALRGKTDDNRVNEVVIDDDSLARLYEFLGDVIALRAIPKIDNATTTILTEE